jgi:hypothetical protein
LLHGKDGSPFEGYVEHPLPSADKLPSVYRFTGRILVDLPADTPIGFYEPHFYVLVRVKGVANPVHLPVFGYEWNGWSPTLLPLVRVGNPKTPKIPWTILSETKFMGRAGTLPESYKSKAQLCARSGFASELILPPGHYSILPSLPTDFPRDTLPPIDGGEQVIPESFQSYLRYESGAATCRVTGPKGVVEMGEKRFVGQGWTGPELENGPFNLDMTQTGAYEISLEGSIDEAFGRTFTGGGKYRVTIANPLTFSTSCKPGTSFLVGNGYPGKVNVNPPFPADVEVAVDFYPNSDPARKKTWVVKGKASRFGHYIPYGKAPLIFDEPGEYFSTVTAKYTDARGVLWKGQQTSTGFIAPVKSEMNLHGTRSFPYNNRLTEPLFGATERFVDRKNIATSFMPDTPYLLMDAFAPYNPEDTLFLSASTSSENIVEPHLSMGIADKELSRRLIEAYRDESALIPPFYQPPKGKWDYLENVVEISTDSFGWFPADDTISDELPIIPVGSDGWHPSAFPDKKRFDAYAIMGIVRPGFPVMTLAFQTEAIGMYWLASPNRFGYHFNAGANGDLPGDMYRIQAGAVLKDLETGKNYYDIYGASIVVNVSEGMTGASSILPPGERPLVTTNGRDHAIFLATDTYDVLEVGETMGFGGLVFPNVRANVQWDVTKPDGEKVVVTAKANRMGAARGRPAIPVDEPGVYFAKVRVSYEGLTGDVVGTANGTFWHCAVPKDNPPILRAALPPVTHLPPGGKLRIPLSWPAHLTDVRLHFGVMMPGQVLDQGVVEPLDSSWEYPIDPQQIAFQFPNVDFRVYSTGALELADTLVFQFFLEGVDGSAKVYDSKRLVLRRDRLFNFPAKENVRMSDVSGKGHPVP